MPSKNNTSDPLHLALVSLTRSGIWQAESSGEAFREVTETVANALTAARVSVWHLTPLADGIQCDDLFVSVSGEHSAGQELKAWDSPAYFQAMRETDIIAAEDAANDPRTRELKESYLDPLGIAAMLDAPITSDGSVRGVLCVEHVSTTRHWTEREKSFVLAAANLISLFLAQKAHAVAERRQQETAAVILRVAQAASIPIRANFLQDLTRQIVDSLEVLGGGIMFLDPTTPGLARSNTFLLNGTWLEDLCYEIAGTPCESVIRGPDVAYVENVQQRFPNDQMLADYGVEAYAGAPLLDEEGQLIGLVAVFSDRPVGNVELVLSVLRIFAARTAAELGRQVSERALAASRHQQELILNSVGEGIYGLDAEGRLMFQNPAAKSILGWTDDEIIGQHSHELIHHHHPDGRDYAREDCPIIKTLADGVSRRVENEVFFSKDGGAFPVEYVCSPVKDEANRTIGAVVAFRDVSTRREAELERDWLLQSLGERVKELTAIHRVTTLLREADCVSGGLMEKVAQLLADAMQFPDCAAGIVSYGAVGGATQNYEDAPWRIESAYETDEGERGLVRVVYLEEKPSSDIGPFLNEEQVLLDSVAEALTSNFERIRATDMLREKQAFLQMASAVGKMGAWSIEVPSQEHRWSEEMRAIHEVDDDDELTLEELVAFYAPEDRPQIQQAFEKCAQDGKAFDEELQLITAKGRRIWVRAIGEAVRDESDAIIRVQGALQDITERKETEVSLERSEERFRHLSESMPMIVWTATPEGEIDYANHRFTEYTGVPQSAEPARRWQPTIHPDDLDRCIEEWNECVHSHTPFNIEYRIRGSEGQYRWFLVQAVPVRNSEGQVLKWYGTASDIDHAKKLEADATQMAARLTTTLESITDAFFTLDRDWRFVYLNRRAEQALRRPRDELIGRNIWEEFEEAEKLALHKEYHRAVAENVAVRFEQFYPPLQMWLEVRAFPSDEGLAVYFRDVTEQRQTREALRENEERFRLLAKATNDALWNWDLATNEIYWNEGFENLFGKGREKIEPTIDCWSNRIHPEDRDKVMASLHRALESNDASWSSEYRFHREDGIFASVLDRGHIIRNADGRAVRMIGGITDLTESRTANEKLREQAALLDKAQDAILVRDLHHQILYWNKSSERLYGWTAEEAIGKAMGELLYRNSKAFQSATEKTIENGEWVGEIQQVTKSGAEISVEGRWTLVRDEDGKPKSILAIHTDITERKRLEAQFLRAQRMESIGTLAGGIAHDLNNILAPILMAIELLKNEETEPQRLMLLDTAYTNGRRGADLVKQVLTFARGIEGKRATVDLRVLTRDIQNIVQDAFPKNIELHIEAPTHPWVIEADATQIHQVLMNLCVNARDAMPEGGRLTLALENVVLDEVYAGMNREAKPGPYLLIRVEDTGKGIARAIQDKVFDPFFTTKEIGKGTGLGLSTVLTIVKSHGGFLNLYSEPGKGAKFKIYLPAKNIDEEAAAVPAEQANLPSGNGELVLLIDDEEAIREVTRKTLERFGYSVVTAANGAEAVATYAQQKEKIAVVLTDMAMPVMDGPATIAALKTMNPRVKIIGCSGLAATSQVAAAMGAGIPYFITKPFTADSLLLTLKQILSAREDL